jgi:hypothetical protein
MDAARFVPFIYAYRFQVRTHDVRHLKISA